MTPDRHARVQELFEGAIGLPPAERTSFLQASCSGDAELFDHLVQLLDITTTAGTRTLNGPRPPSNSAALPLPGATLDRKYRIERELGKGGMGAVYLATHLGTTRTVAVKVIVPALASREEFVVRFQREAAAAGRLRHPNVVNVTDFGVTEGAGLAYLVMEYLDGQTLAEYQTQNGRMRIGLVLDVVEQIALALDAAHAAGIVHRDLKPENIWMESDRRGGYNVKVLDFGIAKVTANDAPEPVRETYRLMRAQVPAQAVSPSVDLDRTMTVAPLSLGPREGSTLQTTAGAIIGTPAYMSPEQCMGKQVDYRADIYSLGVIAFELVAGERPFQGGSANELLAGHILTPAPSPRRFDAEIPQTVATAVLRGLEKNPADRPASAGALAALLRAATEGEFSILRKAKDLFHGVPGYFYPAVTLLFAPVVPLAAAMLLAAPAISKANLIPDGWLILSMSAIDAAACLFGVQLFKAAAALLFLEASSAGAFRPATSRVMPRLIRGLPGLVQTQAVSLLDLRPTSFRDNQLWPVVWAVEGRTKRDAVRRSQALCRAVPGVSLTLVPRFFGPTLLGVLAQPAIFAILPGGGFRAFERLIVTGSPFGYFVLLYPLVFNFAIASFGTVFSFLYSFAAICRGESPMPALPASGSGRGRTRTAKLRPGTLFWWCLPVLLACLIVVGVRLHKVPVEFTDAVADVRAPAILRAIDAGQNVDTVTSGNQTALSAAAAVGDVSLMTALLQRGASPDKPAEDGDTPLTIAVYFRQQRAAELLLARGAKVNLRNQAGRTALMIAAMSGNTGMVSLLLAHGAEGSVRDTRGKSAGDYAREVGSPEVAALLREPI
jgi:serine/threonine protein kinase